MNDIFMADIYLVLCIIVGQSIVFFFLLNLSLLFFINHWIRTQP